MSERGHVRALARHGMGGGWAGTAASFMFQDSTQVKLKAGSTKGESGVDNCHVTEVGGQQVRITSSMVLLVAYI